MSRERDRKWTQRRNQKHRRGWDELVASVRVLECVLDQDQAVVAEEHVAVDENRGRAEPAAVDQFLRVGAQFLLILRRGDFGEIFLLVEADGAHDIAQDIVLADVAVLAPIALEDAAGVRRNFAVFARDERTAHRLDRIYGEHRRMADLDAVQMGPVLQVLLIVAGLGLHRIGAHLVDRRVDGVEDAADEDRLPYEVGAMAARDIFDFGESQVGPRTRAVVEKFEYLSHRMRSRRDWRNQINSAST